MLATNSSRKYWVICVLIAVLAICSGVAIYAARSRSAVSSLAQLPPVILWAWERPEDLSFLDPHRAGVAYLARTIRLRDDRVISRPRLQPLNVPEGTRMIAVARIETDRSAEPALNEAQITSTVEELLEIAAQPRVAAVQIDFDATTSERVFYREVIARLRKQLKPELALSITALGSWCEGDDWISQLPVDEAVPMLFRMGVDRERILSRMQSQSGFTAKPCQSSAGVSTDEPLTLPFATKRLYIFSPNPWSEASFKAALETYQR
jgi:hypothetical protein